MMNSSGYISRPFTTMVLCWLMKVDVKDVWGSTTAQLIASWLCLSLHVQHVPACVLCWYNGLLHIRPTGDFQLSLNVIECSELMLCTFILETFSNVTIRKHIFGRTFNLCGCVPEICLLLA